MYTILRSTWRIVHHKESRNCVVNVDILKFEMIAHTPGNQRTGGVFLHVGLPSRMGGVESGRGFG
jgi:hypothetical protein